MMLKFYYLYGLKYDGACRQTILSKEDTRSLEAPLKSKTLQQALPTPCEGEGRDAYTLYFTFSGKSILVRTGAIRYVLGGKTLAGYEN